jgi:hypothetical protein
VGVAREDPDVPLGDHGTPGCRGKLAAGLMVNPCQGQSQITGRGQTGPVAILFRVSRAHHFLDPDSRLVDQGCEAVTAESCSGGEQQSPDVDIAALLVVEPIQCIEQIPKKLGFGFKHPLHLLRQSNVYAQQPPAPLGAPAGSYVLSGGSGKNRIDWSMFSSMQSSEPTPTT